MPTFHFVSLGCPKNRVDSEVAVADLLGRGFTAVDQAEGADVVVVNTCAFIQPAVEEALDHLLEAARLKAEGQVKAVVALGCLPQRYGQDLADELGEVDLFLTAAALDQAGEKIAALLSGTEVDRLIHRSDRFLYGAATPRALTTSPGAAWVKIAEGCPNACAYCTIPAIRGPQASRPVEDILTEIKALAERGVQEVNLVAQDLTAYGEDLKPRRRLTDLLEKIEELDHDPEWVRLLYLNPGRVDESLLRLIAQARRILPYLDLPLQHAVPRLVRKMGRRPPRPDLLAWLGRLRESIPHIVLRTSLMVGFPGETEADFETLLAVVEQVGFDHLGAFAFCPEPGTRAVEMPDQVPARTAQRRLRRLLQLQRRISRRVNRKWVGQVVPVLVEGPHPESDLLLSGRAWFQAPEVDGQIILRSGEGRPGHIQPARIVQAQAYDLVADLVG